jgi:tol-pal system protein YbgF
VSLISRSGLAALAAALLVGGCATKGAVRRVETELVVLRTQMARQDSARAAELGRIIALQDRILDSIAAGREQLRLFRGEVSGELLGVQEQLVQVQELTGQSQRRLNELRRQLDDRLERLGTDTALAGADTGAAAPVPTATPDQLYHASLQELRRGSLGTARTGFREFVRTYPTHPQLADALYWLGETFAVENPDSAASYYRTVVERFPSATRASTALYKTGLLAEQRGDRAAARAAYQRVIQQYPRSDEADLSRGRLAALRP